MTTQEQSFFLAVCRGLPMTFIRFQKLKSYFRGSWASVWGADIATMLQAGIEPKAVEKFFAEKKNTTPEKELEIFQRTGARLILCDDPDFPPHLLHIPSPPSLLFIRGEIRASDFPSVAVVGSRNISAYGKRVTEKLVSSLAQSGITIVSGLAFGVDILAHQISLQNNARTIAVLGNGIDSIYPNDHTLFAEKIIKEGNGAVISEFLPASKGNPKNFPIRNRIIAGLSKAVIVIEGSIKSGSLITARTANDQGRDVFAVPGDIFSKNSEGTNALISQGEALSLTDAKVVKEMLGIDTDVPKKSLTSLTEGERNVFNIFADNAPKHINQIIHLSGTSAAEASSIILILEMKGWITALGNQMYAKSV